ncbi:MAG TPA: hypothetical protein VIC54_07740 [Terriglobales bacterium]|jgi:hypothetical protein
MQPFSDLLASVPRAAQRAARGVPASAPALALALAPALAWALAAGPPIAARSRALGLRDGVLRVELDAETDAADGGMVLRRQIESVAAELRATLNTMLGPQQVQRLEFSVSTIAP